VTFGDFANDVVWQGDHKGRPYNGSVGATHRHPRFAGCFVFARVETKFRQDVCVSPVSFATRNLQSAICWSTLYA
jgi:hypothetical protein